MCSAPACQSVTARMLPDIRAELVQWLGDPGPEGGQARWAHGFDPQTAVQERRAALVVTWLLMGQTLVSEEEMPPSKASVKHLRRIDPALLTSVRYVRLRHAGSAAREQAGEGGGRSHQVRWIVRGHWRNHWYPSRQAHRPIWIDAHMKGPDGAPILDPDKLVNVLRR